MVTRKLSHERNSVMEWQSERNLARAIRRSAILDRKLKEYWLNVLPHLDDSERLRLWTVLKRADESGAANE